jgi:hypothetical protein
MFRMRPVLFLKVPCLEQRRRKFRTPLRSSPRGWPGSPTGPPARPRPRRPRPRSNNRQQAHTPCRHPDLPPFHYQLINYFLIWTGAPGSGSAGSSVSPRRIRRIQTPPRTPSPPSLRDAGGAPLMAPLSPGEGGEGPPATSTLLGPASPPQTPSRIPSRESVASMTEGGTSIGTAQSNTMLPPWGEAAVHGASSSPAMEAARWLQERGAGLLAPAGKR